MKVSLIFATLVLAFGVVASGCGSDTKGKKAKSGGGDENCESGQVYSQYYGQCLNPSSCASGQAIIPGTDQCGPINPGGGPFDPNAAGLGWYKGNLNVNDDDRFASFIESYGYTRNGRAFCVDNQDDINYYAGYNWFGFPTLGLNINFGGWGSTNCNTFDGYEIWFRFNRPDVTTEGSTLAEIVLIARSSGTVLNIMLPHDAAYAAVRRANQDTEFLIQGYLYKLAYPQDWAYWSIEGNTIDLNASGGADLRIKWDGGVMATSSARLVTY